MYTRMYGKPNQYAVRLDHNETDKHTDEHCAVIPQVVSHKLPEILNVAYDERRIETMGLCDSYRS